MGIGVIVRDSMRELLATLSSLIDYITELDIAKIMVALRDVQLCHELGFYKVILKDNALKVVHDKCRMLHIQVL
jgi:hypothetical protein